MGYAASLRSARSAITSLVLFTGSWSSYHLLDQVRLYLVQQSLIGPSRFNKIRKHSDGKFRVLINQGNKTKQGRQTLEKSLHLFYLQVLGPTIGPSRFNKVKKHSDGKFRVLINQGNKTK